MISRAVCVRFWGRSTGLVARKSAGHHPIWCSSRFCGPCYWVWNRPTINLRGTLQKNPGDQSHGARTDLVLGRTKYPGLRTAFLIQVCFRMGNRGDASSISCSRSFGIPDQAILPRASYQYRHRFCPILQHWIKPFSYSPISCPVKN